MSSEIDNEITCDYICFIIQIFIITVLIFFIFYLFRMMENMTFNMRYVV